MKKIALKKSEKAILAAALLLMVVIIAGSAWLLRRPAGSTPASSATSTVEGLAESSDHFPSNILLGERLPYTDFTDETGVTINLDSFKGKTVVLTFWASWCSYCNAQTENLSGLEDTLAAYDDVVYLLADKLDGKKETRQSAKDYAAAHKLPWEILYDDGLKAYDAWGVEIVPTTVILDKNGVVKACYPGEIKSIAQLQAMLDYAINGPAAATERFITTQLMGKDGGVHVNYSDKKGSSPIGYDVLSEAQGLTMEYAALSENKALFDTAFGFVKTKLLNQKGLTAWFYSPADGAAASNALLDDLRILRALRAADEAWGGYGEDAAALGDAILRYNTDDGHLVDHYDIDTGKKAARLTLCYADFEAIKLLGEDDTALYDKTLALVEGGYIGDAFPLYYNAYDFKEGTYDTGSIHTAEGLYTLYHLAKVGRLKPQSIAWLKEQVKSGGIKARYNTDGSVTAGYNYHSTAVYALLGLIAHTIGDKALLTQAISGMERYRINDAGDKLNGAFGNRSGADISAFDECMPLLLYGVMEDT